MTPDGCFYLPLDNAANRERRCTCNKPSGQYQAGGANRKVTAFPTIQMTKFMYLTGDHLVARSCARAHQYGHLC
jgi:hypothetical protein